MSVHLPFRVFPEQSSFTELQRADRFLQGRLKRTVDGHHLAGGFHLGPDNTVAGSKFIERPARNFDHDVVQRRFKGGDCLTGDRLGISSSRLPTAILPATRAMG